ncbi:hypothetical protein ABZP36_002189 [Zizania latifolia]
MADAWDSRFTEVHVWMEIYEESEQHVASSRAPSFLQAPPPDTIQIETGKEHRITFLEQPPPYHQRSGGPSSRGGSRESCGDGGEPGVPEVSHLGWGHWYTLKELEAATAMFADEKVIVEGGYGIMYHGVLEDGTQVAIKNLLNNRPNDLG